MDIKQLNKYAIYITIGIAACLTFLFIFLNFKILYTDVDSARYMLSALIQSEAAIISIVVTLSLVAVQLAASSYSVRVIDVFRKTPALWMLLTIYGIVIFLGLVVLRMIDLTDPYMCKSILLCQSNLELSIASTYSLGILAYVALAAYIWVIIGLLKPSAIMNLLAEDISKKNILKYIMEDKNKRCSMATSPSTITNMFHSHTPSDSTTKDPMLPIIDIINGSLMNYDYGTLKNGLRIIECRINHIFISGTFKEKEEKVLSNYIFGHITRISRLAIDRGDEYSTYEVINTLSKIGDVVTEKRLSQATYNVMNNMKDIGVRSANQELEWPTEAAANAIANIGVLNLCFNWDDVPGKDNEVLVDFLKKRFDVNWAESAKIEKKDVDNTIKLYFEDQSLTLSLNKGKTGLNVVNDIDKPDELMVWRDNGKLCTPINFKVYGIEIEWHKAVYLELIGEMAIKHGLESTAKAVVSSLKIVGLRAAMKNMPNMVNKTNGAFRKLGVYAIGTNHDIVADEIKKCISDIRNKINSNYSGESPDNYSKVIESFDEINAELENTSFSSKNGTNSLVKINSITINTK